MKNILQQKKFLLFLAALLLFGSCAPDNYGLLFHPLIEYDNDNYWFDGRTYSGFISQEQINTLPEPVKCYLYKSGMLNTPRITECFFEYNGSVAARIKQVNIKKRYRIKDHASGLMPIYQVDGKSFPINFRSTLHSAATFEARIGWKDLMKDLNPGEDAINRLSVLKYLAQMVWYPTAFVNNNLIWSSIVTDTVVQQYCAHIKLREGVMRASGNLYFNEATCTPYKLVGDVSKEVSGEILVSRFEVVYSDFVHDHGLRIPQKCMAIITDEQQGEISIVMKLTKRKPIVLSNLLDKKFKDQQDKLRKRVGAKDASWLKRLYNRLFNGRNKNGTQ